MCILVLFLFLHPSFRSEKYKELQVESKDNKAFLL